MKKRRKKRHQPQVLHASETTLAPIRSVVKRLSSQGMSMRKIAALLSCSFHAVFNLLHGGPVAKVIAGKIKHNIAQLRSMDPSDKYSAFILSPTSWSVTRELRKAAKLVQAFHGVFSCTHTTLGYWVFPPRLCVKQLSEAIESAYKQLLQLLESDPNDQYGVFRDAPKLYADMLEQIASDKRGAKRLRLAGATQPVLNSEVNNEDHQEERRRERVRAGTDCNSDR